MMHISLCFLSAFAISSATAKNGQGGPIFNIPFKTSALNYASAGQLFSKPKDGNCNGGKFDAEYTDNPQCTKVSKCYLKTLGRGDRVTYKFQSPNTVRVDANLVLASNASRALLDFGLSSPGSSLSIGGHSFYGEGWDVFKNQTVLSNELVSGEGSFDVKVFTDYPVGEINLCAVGMSIRETFIPDNDGILGENFQSSHLLVHTKKPAKPGKRRRARTKNRGWLEYDVFTEFGKEFNIITRIGSKKSGKTFRVAVDGKVVTGKIPVPNERTENLVFEEVMAVPKIFLEPGQHKVRVIFDKKKIILDKLMMRLTETPKKQFEVVFFHIKDFKTCIIGKECNSDGFEGCINLFFDYWEWYYDEGDGRELFANDESLKSVATTSKLREQQNSDYKEVCSSFYFFSDMYRYAASAKRYFKEKVTEWSRSEIDLVIHDIDVIGVDIGLMDRDDNGYFYIGPQTMKQEIEKLDFVPDFIFTLSDFQGEDLTPRHSSCELTSVASTGVAGAGYTWWGLDDQDYGICDDPDGEELFELWLEQVKFAYENISPGKPFDGKWEPGSDLIANHCKDGVQNYGETSIDSGGQCI